MKRSAVFLMGPTGTGKTDLAVRLADRYPIEIVSVDSALVYRGMDIGTAKPTAAVRARVAHHLIDIRDPAAAYSAGEFIDGARTAMQEIWDRGQLPLLVGGTMFYFHALTAGIADLPDANLQVRADIDARAEQLGWREMHRELATVDPLAASRIHSNDPQRIQRALEVFKLTGEPISRLQEKRVAALSGVHVTEIAIAPLERRELHSKIETRFRRMLDDGLLAEVESLFKRSDLSAEHPSMRAVGYRQLWRHLAGQVALGEATDEAIAATRQLAKRQLTWLKRRERAQWFDSMHPDVTRLIDNALSEGGVARR